MADTALNEEEIKEFYDSPEVLKEKVTKLSELIKNSKHFVTYTGAGISTAAGIPDFRGPDGVWTLRAKGEKPKTRAVASPEPTMTHMSLVQLMTSGYLKYLVSQNCDGLHVKSGITPDKISEVHGNTNVEACAKCGKLYYRGYKVRKTQNKFRVTGRRCTEANCNTPLRYTTVAFSQSMPDKSLERAETQSAQADLALCLGTSMRVSPACDLPLAGRETHGKKGHSLVIVNLQKTPFDNDCSVRIYAKVDDVMTMLMEILKLEIPKYVNKNLHESAEWLASFDKDYKFRSPGNDWYTGNQQFTDEKLKEILESE